MPPVDPWSRQVKRREPVQQSETFDLAGEPVTITLRYLDEVDVGLALDRRDDLIAEYVTGRGGNPPVTMTTPESPPRRIQFSRHLCVELGTVLAMQVVPADEEPWEPMQWLGLMLRFPKAWRGVQQLAAAVNQAAEKEDDEGNSSRAATG